MSRIGKQPVVIPTGVTVSKDGERAVVVKGPKGELRLELRPEVDVAIDKTNVQVNVVGDPGVRETRAYHGMTRALLNNMVAGVTKGFEKKLEIQGVGYRAALKGSDLELSVGYSHPVTIKPRTGISFEVPQPTQIVVKGHDKQQVGQTAAEIRKVRPPEPYKGKGIRYEGEYVRRKVGKRA